MTWDEDLVVAFLHPPLCAHLRINTLGLTDTSFEFLWASSPGPSCSPQGLSGIFVLVSGQSYWYRTVIEGQFVVLIASFLQIVQGCVLQNSLENMESPKEEKRGTDMATRTGSCGM